MTIYGQRSKRIVCEEAAAWLARRNAVGPPLRAGMLRQNLRAFARAEVFVEGLIKAGVEE